MKPKRCRTCRAEFAPRNQFQTACSIPCALAQAQEKARKRQRKETAEARKRLMTRRDWLKRAQVAFNAYIRARDRNQPCICCGQPLTLDAVGGGYDCGHYRSVGSAPHLRFNPENAHAQRKQCNRYGAGRAVDYRLGLIARIGLERVEALEADQSPRKYSVDDLQALERHYKALTRELSLEPLPEAA